jgi:hypothetical protein
MTLRTIALALALSCGFSSLPASAAARRPYKAKTIKPKKDPRFRNSQVMKVKPRKAKKARR